MFDTNTGKIIMKVISASTLAAATVVPLIVPTVSFANSQNIVDRILPVGQDFDSDEMPGVLSNLIIKEDDVNFTTGDHFRISLPSGVKWKANHYSPNTVFTGTNDAGFSVVHAGEQELEFMITGNWDHGNNSVSIPLYFEVDGATGDLQLTIDPRSSTITGGKFTFATVPKGMTVAEILTTDVPTFVSDQVNENGTPFETAEVSLQEGTTGIWSRGKLDITLPDWVKIVGYEVSDLSGFAAGGKDQMEKNLNKAIGEAANRIEFTIPSSKQNEKRAFHLKFYVVPITDEAGEITARFNWAGIASKSVTIGKVVASEETDVIIFTIGEKTYKHFGVKKDMDVAPYVEADRTFLPIRYVAEALGIEDNDVQWNHLNRQVTIKKDENTIKLTIGTNIIHVNDHTIKLDVAPKIVNDRTMLPLRAVSDALGAKVDWNEEDQTITVK